ncbi:acetyltransferase, GNAT family protein [Pseudoalteromonas tunicata D2]|uniref:Acetyltransferase, GNAT family protein n=1 Tax=Pseudoalteromonas tunicata D2 TaxID=87626 RepID=A4C4B6_9GAMM|nr:acetyltransferase, GNAT family protein [Pseudoalteromonas tunicata D2]
MPEKGYLVTTLALAKVTDIDEILALHARYQVDTISIEDKKDGFITTAFNREQLTHLIEQEQGLFIAKKDECIVAYVMAASWHFWSAWPMFAFMIKSLHELSYQGISLTIDNSYQYGPVCVDKSVRGQGVFEQLFEFSLAQMAGRFDVLVTFINKVNPRSFAAHTKKVKLDVLQEFEYNNNQYYELVCLTKR